MLCGIALSAFLPGKKETVYIFSNHLIGFFSLVAILTAFQFKDKILPWIDEQAALSLNLVFLYSVVTHTFWGKEFLLPILMVPTLATILNAIVPIHLEKKLKIFFYVWYLVLMVGLVLFQFSYARLFHLSAISLVDAFLFGMTTSYLVIHAWYLYEFVPIPGKRQSIEDRMKQWGEFIDMMAARFTDKQVTSVQGIAIISIQIFSLVGNYFWKFMPDYILTNFWIVLVPHLVVLFHRVHSPNKS